ncbi:ParB/RepB/Spo0J family partition protein [Variovorax ginsengisoli]|uniref:ParB family chromosome partitioning protein n=1 Tax=Variovorax ginsengisoli TaxID=363844 RepID=A0ABT9SDI6_9BURK|nr:ParB/RepB/Spo0J family partition protein [Variovorax ginsengisoli]MDP9902428.1 ParB family chromosome partitioning protein [Variovorax ginsengisoli]
MNAAANPLGQSMTDMFKNVRQAAPTEVLISLIDVTDQVRDEFEDAENTLQELAETIKAQGVIQPIYLRTRSAGRYELVAGERRLRAAKMAGLEKIPCLIRTLTDEQAVDAQFVENIHRKNLTQMEEARQLKKMLNALNGDREALAQKVKKKQPWITQRLNLLDLSPQAQRLVDEKITADVTAINTVRQVERLNPAAAKALVDQAAAAKPGAGGKDLRAKADAAKKQAKVHSKPGSAPAAGKAGAATPSTATPRDRSVEAPGAPSVQSGGSIFPTAPLKPHERAIGSLVASSQTSGADIVTILGTVPKADLDLVVQQGTTFFERGRKTEDLAQALIAGIARNEFGKGPVELFNLVAFLQGQGKAEKFEVDQALAKINISKK